jgi:hypothetical protein
MKVLHKENGEDIRIPLLPLVRTCQKKKEKVEKILNVRMY